MAVEETEITEPEETAEQKAERERQEELTAARDAQHKAELQAAKAEGEAEALRRNVTAPPSGPSEPSEAQWQAMEAESGMSRDEIRKSAKLTGALLQNALKPLQEETAAARQEAREAREENKRLRAEKSVSRVEEQFYANNPALAARRGDMEDFLAMLPDEVKTDPKKYADALGKAKTYVIGKAKENLNTRRGGSSPSSGGKKTGASEPAPLFEDNDDKTNPDLDVSDLENRGAIDLIQHLHAHPGGVDYSKAKPLSEMSRDEALTACTRKDGRGVSIDESGEWLAGARKRTKELIDLGAK